MLCGGTCKPIAGSHAAEPMGWISSYLDRRPLPRHGGGVGGAESSAASGGCSEAEHPQRSKKSSKRAARRFFRAPQGGWGRCARGYLGSVSVRSTDDASASFVSSTASDRKGFVKGESVPLDRVLPTFARTKVGPRRVGVQMNTFCKTPRRRRRPQTIPIGQACSLCLCKRLRAAEGDYNLDPKILLLTFHPRKATPPRAGQVPPGIVPPAAEYR